MEEIHFVGSFKKHARIKGVFRFLLKSVFWCLALVMTAPFWLLPLLFYSHFNPYGHARFDRTAWLLEEDEMKQAGRRCAMAGRIVEETLKTGMSQAVVEEILGVNEKPYFSHSDGTQIYAYYLGWCSPMAWDPDSLMVHYDVKGVLLSAYNMQH